MAAGLLGVGSEPTYVLGAGAFGVLVGTALLSPVLGRPVLAGLGWVYRRAFGAVGLMAEQNTRRNPRRTAATASALMIGVSLVTMMAVLGASAKASLDQTLAEDIIADYVVTEPRGAAVLGVRRPRRRRGARGGPRSRRCAAPCSRSTGTATSPPPSSPSPIDAVARPEVTSGSLADLDATSAAVSTTFARDEGLSVGSTVTIGYAGDESQATVVATYIADSVLPSDLTDLARRLRRHRGAPTDRTVYVVAQPGADRAALRRTASTRSSPTCRR